MADTGIGAGLPALDASAAAARKGARTDKQDASGDKASFGNALEQARDGKDRSAADTSRGDQAAIGDVAEDDKADTRKSARDGAHGDEDGKATRSNRPTIDIRMTGRIGTQSAAASAGGDPAAASGTGQPAVSENLAAGTAAVTVAKLPKHLRPSGQAPSQQDGEADPTADDTAEVRPHDAAGDRNLRLRKGLKAAHGEEAGQAKAIDKVAPKDMQASAESDALTLLQAGDDTAAAAEEKASGSDKGIHVAAKADPQTVALVAHAMPAKAGNDTAKSTGEIEHVGAGKGETSPHGADVDEAGGQDTKTDAPATGGRTFRFSRANGRGQTLDMVIGANRKEPEHDLHKSPVETVTVVDSRRYLALSQNSNTIMSALAGDPEWTSAMQPSSALSNAATMASTGKVVNTLKIQIHPMTLGTVTATMRLAGDELTVDLSVETVAAYRQLSDDQRGLVDSLRAQGFAVDRVSITLVSPSDKTDSSGAQTNGQNASFGQQSAQDGGASPRRDDRHAAQQNSRGSNTASEDRQTGSAAGPGGARPGQLYV